MLAKKLFALCREFPVAGAVPATTTRFAPQRVNHSQNPQINEVIMSIIKKLVASFVGLNPAGPRSAMKLLSVLLAFILGATLWVGPAAAAEKKYVTDPTTGKMVSAPEYGGTITTSQPWTSGTDWATDSYFRWGNNVISGVVEKLGIGNWGIDRDVFDFKSQFLPEEFIIGRLAESWEISPDRLTYTFHIRPGVHWHNKPPMNGRLLTAQDVAYNFNRVLGLGKFTEAGPTAMPYPAKTVPWESITATDDATVVIKLKEPWLPALTSMLVGPAFFIMPPEVIEQHGDVKDWRNLVGTGPFMMVDRVGGTSITWVKNPDYWGHDEKYPQNRLPYVDELKVLVIPELASIFAALRAGKLDYQRQETDLDAVLSLQRTNPEIKTHFIYFRSNDSFELDIRKPPFDDINVRHAMQLALDNETSAATLWSGRADPTPFGLIGNKGYYIPFDEWPAEVQQWYRYDPEAAEKLLDEAGYPRGADGIRFKTILNYGPFGASLDHSEIAAAYWGEIGVEVEINALPSNPAYADFIASGEFEGINTSIAGAKFDPKDMVDWLRTDHPTNNRSGHQFHELDAMVDAALAAKTLEEQKRLIAEADMYAVEKHFRIWGPRGPQFYFAQPWLIGYNGEMDSGAFGGGEFYVQYARFWIDSALKKEMGH